MQYCSNVRMRRGNPLRAVCVVALLLPGLVLAAPTAGACGRCDGDLPCAGMTTPEPSATTHPCCAQASTAQLESSSLGAEACACGRQPPPAIAAVEAPAPERDGTGPTPGDNPSMGVGPAIAAAPSERPPAPPPSPLIFLIGCVFLT